MIATSSSNATQAFRNSSLFSRVVQDATVYFLMIAWVHLTVIIYVAATGDVSVFLRPCPLSLSYLVASAELILIDVFLCLVVLDTNFYAIPRYVSSASLSHQTFRLISLPLKPAVRTREFITII